MGQEVASHQCSICGGPRIGALSICTACEEAFASANTDLPGTGLDLDRYTTKIFPWEPSDVTPRLLSGTRFWSIFCFGLILIVILLSLLRTPLPTCWEISS